MRMEFRMSLLRRSWGRFRRRAVRGASVAVLHARFEEELGMQSGVAYLDHNPLNAEEEWQGPSISYVIVRDRDAFLVLANNDRDKFRPYRDENNVALRFMSEDEACDFLWQRVNEIASIPIVPGWVRPSEEEMRLERERRDADFERRLAEYNREHGIADGPARP